MFEADEPKTINAVHTKSLNNKRSESFKGLNRLLNSNGFDETDAIRHKAKSNPNWTQSSFFSKSTVTSLKESKLNPQQSKHWGRETDSQFFTTQASTNEPKSAKNLTPIVILLSALLKTNIYSLNKLAASKTRSFESSPLKKNVQFSQGSKILPRVESRLHTDSSLQDKPIQTSISPFTHSPEKERIETPKQELLHKSTNLIKRPSKIVTIEGHGTPINKSPQAEGDRSVRASRHATRQSSPSPHKAQSESKSAKSAKSSLSPAGKRPHFERLRADHSSFIKNNFRDTNFERLRTFEKFAFTTIERDDHKDIVPILEDLRSLKERTGTMFVTDLWSKVHHKDVLQQSHLLEEKRRLEKFAFYKAMQKVRSKKSEMQFLIINNRNEKVLKDILYLKDQKEDYLTRQNNELIEEIEMTKKSKRPTYGFSFEYSHF